MKYCNLQWKFFVCVTRKTLWRSCYHYCSTSFKVVWRNFLCRFKHWLGCAGTLMGTFDTGPGSNWIEAYCTLVGQPPFLLYVRLVSFSFNCCSLFNTSNRSALIFCFSLICISICLHPAVSLSSLITDSRFSFLCCLYSVTHLILPVAWSDQVFTSLKLFSSSRNFSTICTLASCICLNTLVTCS